MSLVCVLVLLSRLWHDRCLIPQISLTSKLELTRKQPLASPINNHFKFNNVISVALGHRRISYPVLQKVRFRRNIFSWTLLEEKITQLYRHFRSRQTAGTAKANSNKPKVCNRRTCTNNQSVTYLMFVAIQCIHLR